MATLDQTPTFSVEETTRLVRELYGLEGKATPLPGERDQNFRIRTEGGEEFVLKIANGRESSQRLSAEGRALCRVARQTGLAPSVRPTLRGEPFGVAPPPDATGEPREGGSSVGPGPVHLVRLLTWIPGTPLARISRRSSHLLRDLGRSLGRVDGALMDLEDPAFTRGEAFAWDLLHGRRLVERHLDGIGDRELGSRMRSFVRRFARETEPALAALPVSVIHNDANDHNVLVRSHLHDQAVTGIIDFGDLTRTLTVAEPAIAAAYAMLDQPDPLQVIANLVAGYHETHPLSEEELRVLYDLALLRLCVSVCMASVQQHQRPEDPYLAISQGSIRRTLPDLMDLPAGLARAALRNACGLDPVPSATLLTERLKQRSEGVAPILPTDLRESPSKVLDLGVASPLVKGDPARNPAPLLGRRIDASLWDEDSRDSLVGVGRYGEARLTYTSHAFTTASGETRTIHLGLDLFAPAGTPIHAPLNGIVHAAADRRGHLDYGPVVILRHRFTSPGEEDDLDFYTLYGHLDRASLARLQVGQTIARGEAFAALGRPSENGGWPPHLHLQMMTDLLELETAFPGVAPPSQRAAWLALCPDPNLLVGVPLEKFPPAESDRERSLEVHRQVLGPGLSLSYRRPVMLVRGWMQHLWDELGRRYLDAYNNVPHVGHSHPRVTGAISRQSALLNTNTRYLSDLRNRYAERLTATLPEPLSVCYLLNSASEANELALRLVRARTGSREMIVLEHAYHGHTTSLIDLSHYKHAGPGGTGAPSWVHVAPIPDVYRGRYRATTPEERTRAGELYAGEVERIVEDLLEEGRRPAAFMAESVPSVGGQIMLPPGYLPSAYQAVRQAGGLCVADEVQTGLGRLGTHFYGFQAQGVIPDIVVLGKPLGNGHPLAAVVTTPDVARAFDTGMEFFSTFGGNTVSCAVGLAVLEVVRDENLQEHALDVGARMLAGLDRLAGRHEIIGDVRGRGLFLGVELVRDRESREPAGPEAAFVADRMRELGSLVGTEGPDENVLKIRPPMPFTHEDAEILLDALARIMTEEAF